MLAIFCALNSLTRLLCLLFFLLFAILVVSDERLGNRLINRHGFQQMGEYKEKDKKKYLLGLVEEG